MCATAARAEVVVCDSPDALARKAVERIVRAAREAITARDRFTLVLSGGSTPERTYQVLAALPPGSGVDWKKTWLFFGDERCVRHDDPLSNFSLVDRSLLKTAEIPPGHVIAVPTDLGSAARVAQEYDFRLKDFFHEPGEGLFPRFDLVLLGLGDDGHTASLFPGKAALIEQTTWVTWSPPGKLPPPVDRVTFTFPVLNAARRVMFLVSGAAKATIVERVLDRKADPNKYPAAGVRPQHGTLAWLLDEGAAGILPR